VLVLFMARGKLLLQAILCTYLPCQAR